LSERRLDVDPRIPRSGREGVRFGRGKTGEEGAVHEQAPDLLERHRANKVLDVHSAVAKGAALLVGLGNLGRKGDDAFEPGLDLAQIRTSRGC
jgi:hypothetical protein